MGAEDMSLVEVHMNYWHNVIIEKNDAMQYIVVVIIVVVVVIVIVICDGISFVLAVSVKLLPKFLWFLYYT